MTHDRAVVVVQAPSVGALLRVLVHVLARDHAHNDVPDSSSPDETFRIHGIVLCALAGKHANLYRYGIRIDYQPTRCTHTRSKHSTLVHRRVLPLPLLAGVVVV